MDIVQQLHCFPHIQTQIWEYYYRDQVMLELRDRTLLRNEFLYSLITITYKDKPPKHYIANIENPEPGWFMLIDYWHSIRMINKFENAGYRCTYSEFFDLMDLRLRQLWRTEKKLRQKENKLDLLVNAVLCTGRKWIHFFDHCENKCK